jgi:hypothetical protein
MMCIVHYISALRRLKESKKTVMMLGGPDEAPPMIVAQNQMIVWEVEYYQEESFKFLLGCVAAIIILIPPYIYLYGG